MAEPRQLARQEGILAGGSSGTAVAAALRYARRLGGDQFVVALCADTGRNYLTKLYDDDWLAANRLTWTERPIHTIGELLRHTADNLLEVKNFGVTSLTEIRAKLAESGLKLQGD